MGNTPPSAHLIVAIRKGKLAKVQQIVESPTLTQKVADVKDELGFSTLHVAAEYGHAGICSYLIDKGALVNARQKPSGVTPLHRAASMGHVDVVELLLNKGATLEAAELDGTTPFLSAAFENRGDVMKFLLSKGARHDVVTPDGGTALIAAARKGHLEATRILIQAGCDVNARDKSGNTALHRAHVKNYEEIILLLIEAGANRMARNLNNQTPDEFGFLFGNKIEKLKQRNHEREAFEQEIDRFLVALRKGDWTGWVIADTLEGWHDELVEKTPVDCEFSWAWLLHQEVYFHSTNRRRPEFADPEAPTKAEVKEFVDFLGALIRTNMRPRDRQVFDLLETIATALEDSVEAE